MIRLLDAPAGPTLVLGDCLALVLTIRKDEAGEWYGDCPICGVRSTDTTARDGSPVTAQIFDDTNYLQGGGVLVPCGHEVGAITVEVGS